MIKKHSTEEEPICRETSKSNAWQILDEQNKPEMSFPVEGKSINDVNSSFGPRVHPIYGTVKNHNGVDILAATGTNVVSATNGQVTFVGWRNGYGNTVEVEGMMSDGKVVKTRYAHLDEINPNLKTGGTINSGQGLGAVGQTGGATGPHLHFETSVDGVLQNPIETLSQYQKSANQSINPSPLISQ